MSERIDTELVKSALHMATMQRSPASGLLHHSDRGVQYASDAYQQVLDDLGIVCSMSRKGDCWDNAMMESFFASLKTEWVYGREYRTREEAKQDIFKYIEMFYNRQRRHAALRCFDDLTDEEAQAQINESGRPCDSVTEPS